MSSSCFLDRRHKISISVSSSVPKPCTHIHNVGIYAHKSTPPCTQTACSPPWPAGSDKHHVPEEASAGWAAELQHLQTQSSSQQLPGSGAQSQLSYHIVSCRIVPYHTVLSHGVTSYHIILVLVLFYLTDPKMIERNEALWVHHNYCNFF